MINDDRELYYEVSGKVDIVYNQRHSYEAEVVIEVVIDGKKQTYKHRGSARSSVKALEKAIKNANYAVGILR